jgi:hypothetical protein
VCKVSTDDCPSTTKGCAEYELYGLMKTWVFERATITADRVCRPLTTCDNTTQYRSTAPTATSNAKCSDATAECELENNIEFEEPLTLVSNRVCKIVTVCSMTEYEVTPPSTTSNRECASVWCDEGFYRAGVNKTTNRLICAPATPCNSTTQYESTPSTSSTDRVCSSFHCKHGSYLPAGEPNDHSLCKAWVIVCTAAEFESAAPSRASDRICQAIREPCDEEAGDFEAATATATSDRLCKPCSDACASGFKKTDECTAQADIVCEKCRVCGSTEYMTAICTDDDETECAQCTVCDPGYFSSTVCGLTTNAKCSRCSACIADQEYASASCTVIVSWAEFSLALEGATLPSHMDRSYTILSVCSRNASTNAEPLQAFIFSADQLICAFCSP